MKIIGVKGLLLLSLDEERNEARILEQDRDIFKQGFKDLIDGIEIRTLFYPEVGYEQIFLRGESTERDELSFHIYGMKNETFIDIINQLCFKYRKKYWRL